MSTTEPTDPDPEAARRLTVNALLVTAGAVMISFAAVFTRLADVPATTSAAYRMLFGSAALAPVSRRPSGFESSNPTHTVVTMLPLKPENHASF